jgi:HEAT repeat protein
MLTLAILLLTAMQQSVAKKPAEPAESPDAAWTILQNGLADKSADKRAKAAHALGLIQHNAHAQELARKALMEDTNPEVRAQAATALGQMDAASSQPDLEKALKDKELKVVIAAANSLYMFKNPAAYDVYYAVLTGERKGPGLVQSQLETLKDRKQIEKMVFETGLGFVPFGGVGLQAYEQLSRDATSAIRAAAAEKLVTDPDPKTTQALGHACSDPKWRIRLAVVDAIAKRGDATLLFSVAPLLYDSNDDVRFEAAATVIRLSSKTPVMRPGPRKKALQNPERQ